MSTETRSAQPRYWCHICNAEVPIYMAPDPTCQRCNEQFIEELQSDDDPREFLSGTDNNNENSTGFHRPGGINLPEATSAQFFTYSPSTGRLSNLTEGGGDVADDFFQFLTARSGSNSNNNNNSNTQGTGAQQQSPTQDNENNPNNDNNNGDNSPNPLNNFVHNILTSVLGPNIDVSGINQGTDENGQNTPMFLFGNLVDGNIRIETMPRSQNNNNESEDNTEGDNNNTNNARGNNFAGSILQFLSAMAGTPLDGGMIGNPNDYVFSQTALDNIITQLMEQAGNNSAPPPAPETVIESLQHRELTDEEKSQETDCAVCKDQFEPSEKVIELPCKHIFHDDCIKPWLKLNSTCPVCRHTVLPEGSDNASNENNNNNSSDNNTQGANNRFTATSSNSDSNSGNNDGTNTRTTFTFGLPNDARNQQGQSANTNSSFGNSDNIETRTATFTFTRPTEVRNQQRTQGQPMAIPLNVSAAFPWVNNLTRQASGNSSQQQQNQSSNNNNNASTDLDDDLDLD